MFDISTFDVIMIALSVLTGYSLPQPWWAKIATDWIMDKIKGLWNIKRK